MQKWLLGNHNSSPAKAERKDLTSRPFILGKAAIQEQKTWAWRRKTGTQCNFQNLSIVRCCIWFCMISEVQPLLSLLVTCLKQWISSTALDANAVIRYTHHSTGYLKTVQWLFWRVENPFVIVTFFFFLREKGRIHFAFTHLVRL